MSDFYVCECGQRKRKAHGTIENWAHGKKCLCGEPDLDTALKVWYKNPKTGEDTIFAQVFSDSEADEKAKECARVTGVDWDDVLIVWPKQDDYDGACPYCEDGEKQ